MNPDRQAMIERGGGAPDNSQPNNRNCHTNRTRSYRDRDNSGSNDKDRHGRDDRDRNRERSPTHRTCSQSRDPRPPRTGPAPRKPKKFLTEDEQSQQFVANEDQFVLTQAKKKATIRIRERRAQPIDYLAFPLRYVEPARDDFDKNENDIFLSVPAALQVLDSVKGLEALKTLKSEIIAYETLESFSVSLQYWKSVHALVQSRIEKLSGLDESRVVESVKEDIDRILSPKTYNQLETLEGQIRNKLDNDNDIDIDYWEQLLKSLLEWKAKATIVRITDEIRRKRVEALKERDPEFAAVVESGQERVASAAPPKNHRARLASAARKPFASSSASASATSSTAPPPPPPGTARFVMDGPEDFSSAAKLLYEREVARGIRDDEEILTAEAEIASQPSIWNGKYRPRKPQYFNRVRMGYDWTRYNQTHYDHDHPPPKIVQGYKFNIFYPDLIDKTQTPTFKIIRENKNNQQNTQQVNQRNNQTTAFPGECDTCLIRFIAGPPYQDIAFRIVDSDWDYSSSHHRGFRSRFDNGILTLHFKFKKIHYKK